MKKHTTAKAVASTTHLALVTPVFNRRTHTKKFLQSLKKQKYRDFVTIITDDGSTDGTSEMIKKEFPEVVLVAGNGTLWWSGGTNKAIAEAIKLDIPYILTINDDVELPDDYLENIVSCSEDNPNSLIGSKVCYAKDREKVWFFGAIFSNKTGDMAHVTGRDDDFTEISKSQWLTGMGVLIPTKVFDKIGLYNQAEFPQYFGDAEMSVRAKDAGYGLLVCPDARVYADVDASWVLNQINKPRLTFPIDLLFSVRSPYQLKTRGKFYRRHWVGNWRIAMMKLYLWTLKGLYFSFLASSVKHMIGIKSFRQLIGRPPR